MIHDLILTFGIPAWFGLACLAAVPIARAIENHYDRQKRA